MMFLTSKPPVPGRSLKLIKRDEKVPSTMVVLIAESGIDADWSPSPVDWTRIVTSGWVPWMINRQHNNKMNYMGRTAMSKRKPASLGKVPSSLTDRAAYAEEFTEIEEPLVPAYSSVAAKLMSLLQLQFSHPEARAASV
jgi:hypothetical protein